MNLKLFSSELSAITDLRLIALAKRAIEKAPAYLNTAMSSSTGQYHPMDERLKGGFVRHMKKSFVLASEGVRRYKLDTQNTEIAMVAALIHDIPYRHDPGNKVTNYQHPFDNAAFHLEVEAALNYPQLIAAIFYHMDHWCDYTHPQARYVMQALPEVSTFEHSPITKVVQEADYYSSRDCVYVAHD